jgi:hypothetical protein
VQLNEKTLSIAHSRALPLFRGTPGPCLVHDHWQSDQHRQHDYNCADPDTLWLDYTSNDYPGRSYAQ